MVRRGLTCVPGLLFAAALTPAWGQQPTAAPSRPPSPAAQETTKIVEQVGVLKALNPLRFSADQVQTVLDILKPGMQRLQQQDQTNARQLAAVIPQLQRTVIPANATASQTTPAELEYHRLQQVNGSARDRVRAQLRDELRTALEKLATPEQHATLLAEGKALFIQQRLQDSGVGNRGSVDATARTLDQLRQSDARSYPNDRQTFAMRSAGVPVVGQLGGQGGAGGGPGGGFRGRGGPGGQGGNFGGRGGQGGQGGQRTLSPDQQQRVQQLQQQAQQQLNDPAVQGQVRQYVMLADQIRRMPESTYQQQRGKVALQVWQTQQEGRIQARPQDAVDAFIEQVLLAPSATEALEAKLKQVSSG